MRRALTPAERLIVAADFKPSAGEGRESVRRQVLSLADDLYGTGVYLKVNSALRAGGYGLITEIQSRGLKVFADLKLYDIGETLSTDGVLLIESKPDLLTTVCSAGVDAMQKLKAELPDTEVLGVTFLTSLTDSDAEEMHGCETTEEAVMRFANLAKSAGIDGLISSAKELAALRAEFGDLFTYNTPAIRPTWAIVPGDDQNPERIMTPAKAIKAGADRVVVGRPISRAANPYNAVMRTIDEIASAM